MNEERSLSEVHSSVTIPEQRGFLRRLFAFAGPAYLVAGGCMGPGDWAAAMPACALAEVIGAPLGLQLLFGIPLMYGVLITALDTFLILFLHQAGIRKMEAFILVLVATLAGCFLFAILVSPPHPPR